MVTTSVTTGGRRSPCGYLQLLRTFGAPGGRGGYFSLRCPPPFFIYGEGSACALYPIPAAYDMVDDARPCAVTRGTRSGSDVSEPFPSHSLPVVTGCIKARHHPLFSRQVRCNGGAHIGDTGLLTYSDT